MSYYSHVWAVIHGSALRYVKGVSGEMQYERFYTSLAHTLECPVCIGHYIKFIHKHPPDFSDLFGWTVKLHNSVNERIGKPILTREEAFEIWSKE